jgi:hypothetical protein
MLNQWVLDNSPISLSHNKHKGGLGERHLGSGGFEHCFDHSILCDHTSIHSYKNLLKIIQNSMKKNKLLFNRMRYLITV